jgi:hypothetical protein
VRKLIGILVTLGAALVGLSAAMAAPPPQCDRACLIALADQYLAAMVKHNPKGLPLAAKVKYTEDTATIPIGDGLWVGASEGPATFKIYVADPTSGQIGFYGVLKEYDKPVILALRLKVEKGKITEIEHVLARNLQKKAMPNLVKPRPAFLEPVPPAERVPRAEMLRIANSYFDSIEQDKGSVAPFADDCVRHENGVQTTTNKPPDPNSTEGDAVSRAWAKINALGCRAQIDSQILTYITRIRPRRLVIVDEELGIVFGFPMFVHRGDVRLIHIVGVPGVDTMPMPYGPFNLQAGEMFKIRGGQIHEIEANGFVMPYGSKSGWE